MLNKKELISAFQKLADEHLVPGKREDDKRRVYGIIIDDVRIENLNKFIKKHFIETERSAGGTFKQVTSNYIDAASYFTDHELSLMFYTCFSYKTVYYIQHKDKSLSIDYWDSKTKFNNCNKYNDTYYLAIDGDLDVMPATPNNYYIPQHFDITNANLGELESHMDKSLEKARSVYVKLYDHGIKIWESINEYENTINNADELKVKKVKDNSAFFIVFSFLPLFIPINFWDEVDSKIIYFCVGLFVIFFIPSLIYSGILSNKNSFEKVKTALKGELLEVCKFLKDCYFSHRSDEKLSKLEKYSNNFDKGWNVILKDNKEKVFIDKEKLPYIKELGKRYNQIKEKLEEGWKDAGGKSVYYEYHDKLGWDYDINMAKEKFSGDDEL